MSRRGVAASPHEGVQKLAEKKLPKPKGSVYDKPTKEQLESNDQTSIIYTQGSGSKKTNGPRRLESNEERGKNSVSVVSPGRLDGVCLQSREAIADSIKGPSSRSRLQPIAA